MQEKEKPSMKEILLAYKKISRNATAKIAHLQLLTIY